MYFIKQDVESVTKLGDATKPPHARESLTNCPSPDFLSAMRERKAESEGPPCKIGFMLSLITESKEKDMY